MDLIEEGITHPTESDKIGGFPAWINDDEYLKCQECESKAKHLFLQTTGKSHISSRLFD